jgi:hypothetical protein
MIGDGAASSASTRRSKQRVYIKEIMKKPD